MGTVASDRTGGEHGYLYPAWKSEQGTRTSNSIVPHRSFWKFNDDYTCSGICCCVYCDSIGIRKKDFHFLPYFVPCMLKGIPRRAPWLVKLLAATIAAVLERQPSKQNPFLGWTFFFVRALVLQLLHRSTQIFRVDCDCGKRCFLHLIGFVVSNTWLKKVWVSLWPTMSNRLWELPSEMSWFYKKFSISSHSKHSCHPAKWISFGMPKFDLTFVTTENAQQLFHLEPCPPATCFSSLIKI